MGTCENCAFRKKYDSNPRSILGRLWRWHINWCPGWSRYYRSLDDAGKKEIAGKYGLTEKGL